MALVGSYVGLSKILVIVFPIFLLAWLRFGIAAVAMLAGCGVLQPRHRSAGTIVCCCSWESFLGNFLFSVCMLFGVALTLGARRRCDHGGDPRSRRADVVGVPARAHPASGRAGIACAVSGIALVSMTRQESAASAGSLLGNLLLVGAVCCEASYVVIGKRLTGNVGAKRISSIVNLWGLVLVTPLGLWQALHFDFAPVSTGHWALLLFYALAASMVTVWLWMTGLKHVPASSAGVFTVLLPISAAAVGVVFLGERFDAAQAAAFALAVLGVLLATWPARRASPP